MTFAVDDDSHMKVGGNVALELNDSPIEDSMTVVELLGDRDTVDVPSFQSQSSVW